MILVWSGVHVTDSGWSGAVYEPGFIPEILPQPRVIYVSEITFPRKKRARQQLQFSSRGGGLRWGRNVFGEVIIIQGVSEEEFLLLIEEI